MKNTNSNIKTIHPFFNQTDPELVEEFKRFVIMVNEYLCLQCDDVRYHPSNTRGQARHRMITIESSNIEDKIIGGKTVKSDLWKFSGELIREGQPYTDRATFYYRGKKMWEMKRRITMVPSDSESRENGTVNRVQFCALAAAKGYNPDIPWCGPRYFTDDKTGLHYEADYYDHGAEGFTIEESIRDPFGSLLWTAVCEGGYV